MSFFKTMIDDPEINKLTAELLEFLPPGSDGETSRIIGDIICRAIVIDRNRYKKQQHADVDSEIGGAL